MTLRKNLAIALSLVSLYLPLNQVHGYLTTDLEVTNGYRQDRISSVINTYDSSRVYKGSDSLKVKEFNLYQVGLRNRWNLSNFILRVDADYGWSDHAKYREVKTPSGLSSARTHASIKEGVVKDLGGGGGYLFSLNYWRKAPPQHPYLIRNRMQSPVWDFLMGPMGGFSYHEQYFKTRHTHTNGVFDSVLNGLSYRNKWWGPWVGADVRFTLYNFIFNAGYEYHWSSWRASWKLRQDHLLAGLASDRRRTNKGHGNTAYANFFWNLPTQWATNHVNWHMGFGFKYQDIKATDGYARAHADHTSFSNSNEESVGQRVRRATWRSYTVTYDVGASF